MDVHRGERPQAERSCYNVAKKGASGRMQRPPELVLIFEYHKKALAGSGKLLHFGKIRKKLVNI